MHGFLTTNSFQMGYTQFNKTADTARCIVAYPQGENLRWNSGSFFGIPSNVDDVGYISDVIDLNAVLYNINTRKVYATGYSAGGFMCYKLACDRTNRFAAIAPNVASMLFDNLNTCLPTRPMHIAGFNGSADPITPYAGIPLNFPGIDSIKHFWQIKNNCALVPLIDTLPDLKNDGTRVVRYRYTNCNDGVEQVFYKVINGGHTWPGADDILLGILGKTTLDISMNAIAWNFFKDKEIPSSVVCSMPNQLNAVFVSADSAVVSWQAVAGVPSYRVALVDDSNRVHFYETTQLSYGFKLDSNKLYKWNVASLCSSGYHQWNTTRNLAQLPTAIKFNSTMAIALYPNPTTDYIHLDLPSNTLQKSDFSIFDMTGRLMQSTAQLDGNALFVGSLPKGMYCLKITTSETIYSKQFIKN